MRENTDLKTEERKLRVNNCSNFKIDDLHLGQTVCVHQNIIWCFIVIFFFVITSSLR